MCRGASKNGKPALDRQPESCPSEATFEAPKRGPNLCCIQSSRDKPWAGGGDVLTGKRFTLKRCNGWADGIPNSEFRIPNSPGRHRLPARERFVGERPACGRLFIPHNADICEGLELGDEFVTREGVDWWLGKIRHRPETERLVHSQLTRSTGRADLLPHPRSANRGQAEGGVPHR